MQQSKLAALVRTNTDYYNIMVRNGWLLPKITCALVTREYLDGIRRGELYCPHKRDKIPALFCANPPAKKELLKIWKKAVYQRVQTDPTNDRKWNAMLATIKMIEDDGKTPDNDWIIIALSDVPGTDCEIFQKNYKFVKEPKMAQKQEIVFFNDDGLFDDLPELDVKSIRKRNQFRIPKSVKLIQEKDYLEKKQALLQEQMAKVARQIAGIKEDSSTKKYAIEVSEDEEQFDGQADELMCEEQEVKLDRSRYTFADLISAQDYYNQANMFENN